MLKKTLKTILFGLICVSSAPEADIIFDSVPYSHATHSFTAQYQTDDWRKRELDLVKSKSNDEILVLCEEAKARLEFMGLLFNRFSQIAYQISSITIENKTIKLRNVNALLGEINKIMIDTHFGLIYEIPSVFYTDQMKTNYFKLYNSLKYQFETYLHGTRYIEHNSWLNYLTDEMSRMDNRFAKDNNVRQFFIHVLDIIGLCSYKHLSRTGGMDYMPCVIKDADLYFNYAVESIIKINAASDE